jgi:hypothetical protein
MAYRILHCGTSVANYNLCIKEKVAGFINRGPKTGDIVFLSVNVDKETLCGARGRLGDITDIKPWEDADRYPHALVIEDLQFCKPFKLRILRSVDKHYGLKYLMAAHPIVDDRLCELLDKAFETGRTDIPFLFTEEKVSTAEAEDAGAPPLDEGETSSVEPEIIPESVISIMGTFLTINFYNESDKMRGLEKLVNDNFYNLFPQYAAARTVLIPENRMFKTAGLMKDGNSIAGIRSIPDAILLVFNKQAKHPIQINLIEYECYGERKVRSLDKSNYLNGAIIPQLMKFASTFSIVTDKHIREETIHDWCERVIHYVWETPDLQERMTNWIHELKPNLAEQLVGLEIDRMLKSAFKNSIKIVLVIDELSTEQKDTITNVVRAFRLENGESTQFIGYVVRLVQRINILDQQAEYALTVQ